ncbi:hypothetical protein XpopCFBP1817_15080 [Xanthomonas populi]|uniref:Uncharacterized protein n=1 Tax=Xanthomonas populi TaxID=53414 RepID=A0A2S7ELR5_9XANT|nr:hypothetical protein XpopCFBP1817_15080 [Xanthomonas populi]
MCPHIDGEPLVQESDHVNEPRGGERNGGKAGRGSENKRPFVIAVATTQHARPRQAVIDPVFRLSK